MVGFLLLMTALAVIVIGLAPIRRGHNRSVYAALFAAAIAWAVATGVEWNWEMPAVTLWLFAIGGAALAARADPDSERAPPQWARVAVGLALLAGAVAPGLVLASQHRLDDSVTAYYAGDCPRAMDRVAASISALEIRPEPYEVIAYCQVRHGNGQAAVRAMKEAVEREPGNWAFQYGLALVEGASGLDSIPSARAAKRLNPHQIAAVDLLSVLLESSPAERRRVTTELARTQYLIEVR